MDSTTWKEAALQWFDDLAAQGILMTDAELNIRGWNQWLESHSGRSQSEMLGRNLFEMYPDLVERRLDQCFTDALAGRVCIISQRLHGYLLPMPPDSPGSFSSMQQSARVAPLAADGRVLGTISVIEDVTERVERENRLVQLLASEKAARAEAEAANRAKDEFLAIVSHELRTPLNAISGWAQILRNSKSSVPTSHALEAIERNAKAQAKLIEDILDASRIITGKLRLDVRAVDLISVIESAIETVRPAADARSIQIDSLLDPMASFVSGDPTRLQQIIWNLLSNAIKFTTGPGRVEVRLRQVDRQAEIAVKDSGQGISPEFLPFVFERFRQADAASTRRHGGLGLGLAIVRHLTELHGGTVHAESEGPGRGAIFTLRLPLLAVQRRSHHQNQDSAVDPATDGHSGDGVIPGPHRPLEGLRVLVVDDEADAREMLYAMFKQNGAEARAASTSREALEIVSQWAPEVLVSDVGMPDEDGYFLISKIRALDPERGGRIPAVALTGYASAEDRLRLLSAGYQIHATKPVELDALLRAVAGCVGRTIAEPKPDLL